jgi:hypothetical protein
VTFPNRVKGIASRFFGFASAIDLKSKGSPNVFRMLRVFPSVEKPLRELIDRIDDGLIGNMQAC